MHNLERCKNTSRINLHDHVAVRRIMFALRIYTIYFDNINGSIAIFDQAIFVFPCLFSFLLLHLVGSVELISLVASEAINGIFVIRCS